jgi:hypothetical protein
MRSTNYQQDQRAIVSSPYQLDQRAYAISLPHHTHTLSFVTLRAEEGKDKPADQYADVKEEDAVVDGSNYNEQVRGAFLAASKLLECLFCKAGGCRGRWFKLQ